MKPDRDALCILSLFDFTGSWSKPYRLAGYNVIQVDRKLGSNIWELYEEDFPEVHGVLASPPCTDFAISGAQWFPAKDTDGRTWHSLALLDKTLDLIDALRPSWWVVENPVGRLERLRPELGPLFAKRVELGKAKLIFQPCDFGDPYNKRTCLFGNFNPRLKRSPVEPTEGSKMWLRYGGKSERTRERKSITPSGFAQAFFEANP